VDAQRSTVLCGQLSDTEEDLVPYVITAGDHSRAVATYDEAIDETVETWNRLSPATRDWSVKYAGCSPVRDMMAEIIGEDGGVAYGLHDGTTIHVEAVEWYALWERAHHMVTAIDRQNHRSWDTASYEEILDAYNSQHESV
jgi:hypothetical protein